MPGMSCVSSGAVSAVEQRARFVLNLLHTSETAEGTAEEAVAVEEEGACLSSEGSRSCSSTVRPLCSTWASYRRC
jgi:hypothetical protein